MGSTSLGAFAAVALPACVAPCAKAQVAALAFVIGTIYALWFTAAAGASAWPALAAALTAGLAAVGWVLARGKLQASG